MSPDVLVIGAGPAGATAARTLALSGAKRIALEDPSADDDALPLARAAGLRVVGLPVDEDGIRVDALDGTHADALVITPSHQWPTGAVLSAERRAAVLRWARERGALVIEDERWHALFTDEELERARKRLKDYRYEPRVAPNPK